MSASPTSKRNSTTKTSLNTHYSILGVQPTASHGEIKTAFYRLARQFHPDKKQQQQQQQQQSKNGINGTVYIEDENDETNSSEAEILSSSLQQSLSSASFLEIQKAWETLRDSTLRATYDEELQQIQFKEKEKEQGAIELSLDDLEAAVDEETGETFYVYDCRCGEEVVIEENELESGIETRNNNNNNDNRNIAKAVECPGCCFVYKVGAK